MPLTYVNITSTTLSVASNSVTFSSIPATYTDLVVRCSVRSLQNDGIEGTQINLAYNGETATTTYSYTILRSNGSAASSLRISNDNKLSPGWVPSALATANTFSNTEIYIPNYAVSQNKQSFSFGVPENNATAAPFLSTIAHLWRNTNTISSIRIFDTSSGFNFAVGSSFYLYGIKNS